MHANDSQPETPRTSLDLLPNDLRPYVVVFSSAAMAIALLGYLAGIRENAEARPLPPQAATVAASDTAPPARTYAEMPVTKTGPNANWKSSLAQFPRPGVFEKVERTEEMKLEALADRSANRAYDGAPPTIPHPIQSSSAKWCLSCHESGLKVGTRIASKISHARFTNCTQCHVPQSMEVAHDFRPVENGFSGLKRAGPGGRAGPGAPPTIPHHTLMRENCASCHGLVARPGLRTTHPWFANCTQCHAPSAAWDQAHFGDTP